MIRLQSFSVRRFRGIREGSIHGLADVNLLVGRNNSGKTTVLEGILRLFFGSQQQQDLLYRQIPDLFMALRFERDPYAPEFWYRQDQSQPILLEGQIGDSNSSAENKAATLSLPISIEPNRISAQRSVAFAPGGITKEQVVAFTSKVFLFRPLDAIDREIEQKLWPRLLANRRDKVLMRILNEVFNLQAEGLQLLPDNRLMVLFEDYSLPLDLQGDGTRAALRMLMVLAMMQNTLLLLEEPESYQHPGSLGRFAQAICRLAHEQGVQLLIATHSAECVRSFLSAAEASGSEGAVFHLTLENGLQTARRLDNETVETLQSTGVDIRFLDLYA
jgi:hypothetical protein